MKVEEEDRERGIMKEEKQEKVDKRIERGKQLQGRKEERKEG